MHSPALVARATGPLLIVLACAACKTPPPQDAAPAPPAASAPSAPSAPVAPPAAGSALVLPQERRLTDVRKLTSGGENAEAYWSFDGTQLIFQRRDGERTCDQMMVMGADGSNPRVVSSEGAHTCGFFLQGDQRVIFASTRLAGPDCPPPPDRSKGYVWALHPAFDLFTSKPDGTDVQRLTETPGYDAEATVSPKDGTIVFTSVRDGDLDIYAMKPDGSDVRRLTTTPGYDGGPVFSADGTKIVYRAQHLQDDAGLKEFKDLLAEGLVRPSKLELWVMNADGSDQRQVTTLGRANFAPTFTPDGQKILFSSNHHDEKGREFDLFLVNVDGTGLEQVTFSPEFDGFPLFSPDGTRLAFCSNRANSSPGETNVFTAAWVP